MTTKNFVLTDADGGKVHGQPRIDSSSDLQLAGGGNWFIEKQVLRGGLSEGVEVVEIHNGALSLQVLPTRGMGLWRGSYRGIDIGWQSPVQRPVNPAFVDLHDRGGLGWLAGFNELLCRCGLAWNGPPGIDPVPQADGTTQDATLTLHGRIANLPAHRVEVNVSTDGEGALALTGVVDEAMMFGTRLRLTSTVSTALGSNRIQIHDRVTNLAGTAAEMQMLYHTNIGPPLLDAGAQFAGAFRQLAPRDPRAAEDIVAWSVYKGPTTGYAEQVHYLEPAADEYGNALVMLRNAKGDNALTMQFSVTDLPCFSLWKNTQAEADGYCTGLEPATNYPNLRTFERKNGRVVSLEPGASWETTLELAVQAGSSEVQAAESAIREAASGIDGQIHPAPHPTLSPP